MAFKTKMSAYHKRLFLLLLGLAGTMVACFVTFQYHREKLYKVEILDGQLQLFNSYLIDAIERGTPPQKVVADTHLPINGLRISVLTLNGQVVFDNSLDTLPAANHRNRPEIQQALHTGTGYTIRRHSESNRHTYFYSAMKGDKVIVRSAVPYSVSLQALLEADSSFFWFMLAVTLTISTVGYFVTRRIGLTITRLNRFAERAEKGEPIYDIEPFPADELGSISNHIIRLYVRQQQTAAERDSEHKRAFEEEQDKNRIKKQLANNINHELKTPVASIKACLETLLAHRDLPTEKHWDFIKRCYTHTERLSQLLADVATITRMDDGSAHIKKETLIINDIVSETVADVASQLANAGMTVETKLPVRITIEGNQTLITSVFRNLIDNAISYSGGSRIIIAFEAEDNDTYTLSVSDNGVGIAEEHLSRIFERFYRIDKGRSRQTGGTGLGLAIVKNAVLIHGGSIQAANLPTGGLTFTFTLRKH